MSFLFAIFTDCEWYGESIVLLSAHGKFSSALKLMSRRLGGVFSEEVHRIILVNNQPDALFQYIYLFISLLYMFRATQCSSPGESIVSILHLVYITLEVSE
jgi:hypothetical protein